MRSTATAVVLAVSAAFAAGCGDKLRPSASVTGEAGQKLALTKPRAVTIRRGEMAKVDVHVSRQGIPGEITIDFDNLPAGISVIDSGNKLLGENISYTLKASDSAALVDASAARVTATAPSGVAVSESFDVSVKEKETASSR